MSNRVNQGLIQNPLVSVVMPIYGVEEYLHDAIESVIGQTLDFNENIELILVNDGSPDNSEAICLQYLKKYPNNIVYIKQKNQGLSATRKNGFLEARGVYVHSMDSDDTISNNFYEKSVDFFRAHENEVDFVASKLILFEGKTGGHYGNYRFKKTQVINIVENPTALQYHISSVIIKRDAVDKKWFDEKLSIGEDARVLGLLVKRKMAYGVISDITYNYRIRSAGGSLINIQHEKMDYYTETPVRFWKYVLDYWETQDGALAPYIQNYVFHDIQWRINEQKKQNILTEQQEKEYKSIVYKTIFRLDDSTIMSQERLSLYKRIYLLKLKHGKSFNNEVLVKKEGYRIGGIELLSASNFDRFFGLTFDFIHDLGDKKYKIEGFPVSDTIYEEDKYFIETSLGDYPLKYVERAQRRDDGFLGDSYRDHVAFESEIHVSDIDCIRAKIIRSDGSIIYVPIHTKRFTKLSELKSSYSRKGNLIFFKSRKGISIMPYSRYAHAMREVKFAVRIAINLNLRRAKQLFRAGIEQVANNSIDPLPIRQRIRGLIRPYGFLLKCMKSNLETLIARATYYTQDMLRKDETPLWIITDRGIGAGDNGEAFFKYLCSQRNLPFRFVFAVSSKSHDYNRMRQIGPVVNMESIKYKQLFLHADKLISSQADEYIVNPYKNKLRGILDLYKYDFVFLQHGITKNDISNWLNRFSKNIKLFVTAATPEYKSILEYPFYYTDKEVRLLGFPRYDLLNDKRERRVILAPTWRKYISGDEIDATGKWAYNDQFKYSQYYQFYNNLLSDPKVLETFKTYGVVGEFYLHPSHLSQIDDFVGSEFFVVKQFPYNYSKALSESSLLITDYSSVYFDFSYLRKPVLYTQFDRAYYYANHGVYQEGYFDERRDGFGPVAENYDEAVNAIVKIVENGFVLDKKYAKRIESFFRFDDKNNSKRLVEAILDMQ